MEYSETGKFTRSRMASRRPIVHPFACRSLRHRPFALPRRADSSRIRGENHQLWERCDPAMPLDQLELAERNEPGVRNGLIAEVSALGLG